MSNPRQEGPSTGLVAAAVLFVAFAAKDLFSEDTPGAADDDDVRGAADGGDANDGDADGGDDDGVDDDGDDDAACGSSHVVCC